MSAAYRADPAFAMPCKAEIENIPHGFMAPRAVPARVQGSQGSSGWLCWTEIPISVLLVMGIRIPMLHGSGFPLGMVREGIRAPVSHECFTRHVG